MMDACAATGVTIGPDGEDEEATRPEHTASLGDERHEFAVVEGHAGNRVADNRVERPAGVRERRAEVVRDRFDPALEPSRSGRPLQAAADLAPVPGSELEHTLYTFAAEEGHHIAFVLARSLDGNRRRRSPAERAGEVAAGYGRDLVPSRRHRPCFGRDLGFTCPCPAGAALPAPLPPR